MTSTPGHIELERSIDSIRIGSRHRTDLGDIDALAASIQRQGLLQPITVTPEGILVCGARRLAALRQLGVRKLNVWVRSGLSDRLTQLLAEQVDDALHKSLSPTEAATLYREVKVLLAEDARRRQEASQFGSQSRTGVRNGGAKVAAPAQSNGRTRAQASLIVTGRRSYTTLDRISDLQRIASDDDLDEALRIQATGELGRIDDGGSVASAHRRVNTQLATRELERLAKDTTLPEFTRRAASAGAARLHTAELETTEIELEQLAKQALARAKAALAPTGLRTPAVDDTKLPVRSFVFLWNDLREWWLRYDCVDVASQITDEQWKSFEETVAGTIDFAERLRSLRAESGGAAQVSQSCAPFE
jgi:ParB family chromosome partitioning protein